MKHENKNNLIHFTSDEITVRPEIDEIILGDDSINVYIPLFFNPNEKFGLNLSEDEQSSVNVYADYYPETEKLSMYYVIRHDAEDGMDDEDCEFEVDEPSSFLIRYRISEAIWEAYGKSAREFLTPDLEDDMRDDTADSENNSASGENTDPEFFLNVYKKDKAIDHLDPDEEEEFYSKNPSCGCLIGMFCGDTVEELWKCVEKYSLEGCFYALSHTPTGESFGCGKLTKENLEKDFAEAVRELSSGDPSAAKTAADKIRDRMYNQLRRGFKNTYVTFYGCSKDGVKTCNMQAVGAKSIDRDTVASVDIGAVDDPTFTFTDVVEITIDAILKRSSENGFFADKVQKILAQYETLDYRGRAFSEPEPEFSETDIRITDMELRCTEPTLTWREIAFAAESSNVALWAEKMPGVIHTDYPYHLDKISCMAYVNLDTNAVRMEVYCACTACVSSWANYIPTSAERDLVIRLADEFCRKETGVSLREYFASDFGEIPE